MTKRPIRKLRVSGERGEARLEVLFDSGSSCSVIRTEAARQVSVTRRWPRPMPILLAKEGPVAESHEWTMLDLVVNGKTVRGLFHIVEGLRTPVVVGVDLMEVWDIHLHIRDGRLSIGFGSDSDGA